MIAIVLLSSLRRKESLLHNVNPKGFNLELRDENKDLERFAMSEENKIDSEIPRRIEKLSQKLTRKAQASPTTASRLKLLNRNL